MFPMTKGHTKQLAGPFRKVVPEWPQLWPSSATTSYFSGGEPFLYPQGRNQAPPDPRSGQHTGAQHAGQFIHIYFPQTSHTAQGMKELGGGGGGMGYSWDIVEVEAKRLPLNVL